MHLSRKELDELNSIYKINFVNSITGYKPANLIATKSKEGISNVAVFSSVVHLGSAPPVLGFILRPTTVPRHTYSNIKETGHYTINHIHKAIIEDAHHSSAKYPEGVSEFDKTTLEEEYLDDFFAPYVKDCPVKIGLKYLEEYQIKSNNTIFVLGEIMEVYVEDHLIEKHGLINLTKGGTAAINGLDTYAVPETNKQLEYQRPKK
jgi:flavin reductase (DIM6/NTAB) family NADH-FMN oxidoreductase RutF